MSDDVARYYDSNTRRFLFIGRGRGVHAMHRELWGPGVTSAVGAVDHINGVVAEAIAELVPAAAPVVVDFGCGVGGTLFHLAGRFPDARLTGITISERQVEIARQLANELGVAARCTFRLADFQTVELGEPADAIVAIEAFAHSRDADAFLDGAARHLRPGGHLIVADDFLAADEDSMDARQRRVVGRFRAGWRVPAICTADHLGATAAGHGLDVVRTVDLTGLTRPGSRVRDRLVAAVSPLLARLGLERVPFCGNLIGGDALQSGLREGFLRYELVALRAAA